ncbi:hypothetical protein WJX74_010060 [Apatococcus lobatus]|uniref:DNA-directed RNA polymerase RBP11-like dimerisation domain-containing protein n=2 Tax=Apatococcus TaxID=904362 RepID=A0AAW1T8H9_9CHLO
MVSRNDYAVTFSVKDEDHTLANPVRFMLNKNPHVSFTGYSITHPAEKVVNFRIQTTGEMTSVDAFRQSLNGVTDVCKHIKAQLAAECTSFQASAGTSMEA